MEADKKVALEKAASDDDRKASALGRKIIVDWLRANGRLKDRTK